MSKLHYENPRSGGSLTMCNREIVRDIPVQRVAFRAQDVTCKQCANSMRKWAEAWLERAADAAKSSGLVVAKFGGKL